MGLVQLKNEIQSLINEFRGLISETESTFEGKAKEQVLKKTAKVFAKLDRIIDSPDGLKARALMEKAKNEINNAMKVFKKKDFSQTILHRHLINANRYFDIAMKDFVETFEKNHSYIAHTNVTLEELPSK